ncbi:MAG: hypothetical protein IJ159_04830 [Prevotella sp.]|nr:hypothetical protein [Prevotella sp.]
MASQDKVNGRSTSLEEELRLDEEENMRELAYIRSQLPSDIKYYSDHDILYLMDAIVDYYFDSGILETNSDEVDIDMEEVAQAVCEQARKDGAGTFTPEEVFFIVQADLDFQEQNL